MATGFSLRRLAIRILFRINPGDITIRHHHTKDKFRLHSFRHKDYWYHGKKPGEEHDANLLRDDKPWKYRS